MNRPPMQTDGHQLSVDCFYFAPACLRVFLYGSRLIATQFNGITRNDGIERDGRREREPVTAG